MTSKAPNNAAEAYTAPEASCVLTLVALFPRLPKLVDPMPFHIPPPRPFEVASTACGTVAVFAAPV